MYLTGVMSVLTFGFFLRLLKEGWEHERHNYRIVELRHLINRVEYPTWRKSKQFKDMIKLCGAMSVVGLSISGTFLYATILIWSL